MEKVYFTKNLDSSSIVKMYKATGKELTGKIAVKLHTGEAGNQNYLKPEYLKEMVDYVHGTVVECNTAYSGERNYTDKHLKLIRDHGWDEYFNFDLMDAQGPDIELTIPNGKVIKRNLVGKNIKNYDSMLILSHFKGHPMGGYGGALKQLSIGCASSAGKSIIHSGGLTDDQKLVWRKTAKQDKFLEAMADAASSVVEFFKGNMVFINIMKNLSVDCDCCSIAEDPCMKDIGILSSLDPIALDQACIDLIYSRKDDPGQKHFIKRIETRHGIHTIESAAELGFGSREYELIEIE